jgi:NADH-quinone oxidoreductase subunit D
MKEEKLHEELYVGRSSDTIDGDISTLNLGPTHTATHGIFQNILKVDGEKILSSEQTVGTFIAHLKN